MPSCADRMRLVLVLAVGHFFANSSEVAQCQSCLDSQDLLRKHGANNAIDALAMAVLSQLSYVSWEEKYSGEGWFYDVQGLLEPAPSRFEAVRRSLLGAKEAGRWLRCAWGKWLRYPHPPGSSIPRPSPLSEKHIATCTPFYLRRRWWLAFWLYDWHEVSGRLRWHNTQVLIAVRASDGALSFSFRGSTDARHLATNLQPLTRDVDDLADNRRKTCQANHTTTYQLPGRTVHGIRRAFARVHNGHAKNLLPPDFKLEQSIASFLSILEQKKGTLLAETLANCARAALEAGKHVFITGHSLGAAHALLLATRISPPPGPAPRRLHVYSFGEPSFGDSVFYKAYHHLNPRVHRFVGVGTPPHCATDIVTRIATFAGAATQHLAAPIHICDVWHSLRGPISAHAMDNYLRSLIHSTEEWLTMHLDLSPSLHNETHDVNLVCKPAKRTTAFISSTRNSLGPPVSVVNLTATRASDRALREVELASARFGREDDDTVRIPSSRQKEPSRRRRPSLSLPRAIRVRWF